MLGKFDKELRKNEATFLCLGAHRRTLTPGSSLTREFRRGRVVASTPGTLELFSTNRVGPREKLRHGATNLSGALESIDMCPLTCTKETLVRDMLILNLDQSEGQI